MYLKDYKNLELSDEEISVLTMVFNSNDSGANANAKNFLHISLNYAIKILKNVSPNAFSEKGEKIRLSILNKLGNEQIKHVEDDEIISYPDLILKMESDMAELSGEDLAELAGHLGINVNYEGDSMFLFKCDHDDEDLGTAGLSFIDDDFEGQPDWRYKNILIK